MAARTRLAAMSTEGDGQRRSVRDARLARIARHPYVALVIHANGLHPASARLITLDAVTFADDGSIGETVHLVFDPGIATGATPGPAHMHGLTPEEIGQGVRFSAALKRLDVLIDGRTLIVHNGPQTWGFIVAEARRAMNAAARANHSRGRGRGNKNRRRTKRVGHVPKPIAIVDTLATARRQDTHFEDPRLEAVARFYGVDAADPTASVERAQRSAVDVASEQVDTLIDLYFAECEVDAEALSTRTPGDLRADRFGLQRSQVRIDALEAPRPDPNPGVYDPAAGLKPGQEFVVAPEVVIDPNELIEAGMSAGLVYAEKLNRTSSLLVCNKTSDFTGKAMHAHRKQIPILSDEDFLAATRALEE